MLIFLLFTLSLIGCEYKYEKPELFVFPNDFSGICSVFYHLENCDSIEVINDTATYNVGSSGRIFTKDIYDKEGILLSRKFRFQNGIEIPYRPYADGDLRNPSDEEIQIFGEWVGKKNNIVYYSFIVDNYENKANYKHYEYLSNIQLDTLGNCCK